ncbi:RNA polymerase sigma factor [Pseudoxanthomonas mexicana]
MRTVQPDRDTQAETGATRPALLASAMRELWDSRNQAKTAELFALASDVFDGRARQYLAREYGLSLEAVEDCIGDALEILLKKWEGSTNNVNEPYAYLWGTANRRAMVMQRLEIEALAEPLDEDEAPAVDSEDDIAIGSDLAAIWYEELTEQDTQPEDRAWVTQVLTLAVMRLPPALRQVTEFMLLPNFNHQETSAKEACEVLGLSAAAYRQNKHRALDNLRKVIPGIVEELGIELTPRDAESIFVDRPSLGHGD